MSRPLVRHSRCGARGDEVPHRPGHRLSASPARPLPVLLTLPPRGGVPGVLPPPGRIGGPPGGPGRTPAGREPTGPRGARGGGRRLLLDGRPRSLPQPRDPGLRGRHRGAAPLRTPFSGHALGGRPAGPDPGRRAERRLGGGRGRGLLHPPRSGDPALVEGDAAPPRTTRRARRPGVRGNGRDLLGGCPREPLPGVRAAPLRADGPGGGLGDPERRAGCATPPADSEGWTPRVRTRSLPGPLPDPDQPGRSRFPAGGRTRGEPRGGNGVGGPRPAARGRPARGFRTLRHPPGALRAARRAPGTPPAGLGRRRGPAGAAPGPGAGARRGGQPGTRSRGSARGGQHSEDAAHHPCRRARYRPPADAEAGGGARIPLCRLPGAPALGAGGGRDPDPHFAGPPPGPSAVAVVAPAALRLRRLRHLHGSRLLPGAPQPARPGLRLRGRAHPRRPGTRTRPGTRRAGRSGRPTPSTTSSPARAISESAACAIRTGCSPWGAAPEGS